ncbi:Proteasome activator BLM10 [Coemansia sp. RSA 1813]|nr:Proteasome activator BLM10 [Coemansia sp. RSA 1843]KAJ2092067.1 Proteasome activator BLM10 [Coemansia sp. RSA 986]KAJ2216597.1 Proteasome activator BLM10 [Coemansia sp. RSA 487]KAJ2572120.1 Proteasome activator BLM10 [Coemansia sp. RSA 1813]
MRLGEFDWVSTLPYNVGDEAAEFERCFVAQFKRAVLSNDHPTVNHLVVLLRASYIRLSVPVRIRLCQVIYELILHESLDLTLLWDCCTTLTEILSKDESITPKELTLDWVGLYSLIKAEVFPKAWHHNPLTRKFFDPSAAGDVLQELLPQVQFNSYDWQSAVLQLLYLFLPSTRLELNDDAKSGGKEIKRVEEWLPTIFSLWSFNMNTGSYNAYLMKIVTLLIIEHNGHLKFTTEQIKLVFATGLQLFNLPLDRNTTPLPRSFSNALGGTSIIYRLPKNGNLPVGEDKAATFAKFIIFTLQDDSPGGTLLQFEQLVQMIEPFYHPSNSGNWSGILARFLRQLSKELLNRSREEDKEDTKVPPSARLPRNIRRRFVISIRTLAMMLLFSKGEDLVSLSHSTLKYLAEVEPDLIFRPLLNTLYTAIDAVTETHRVISAIRALAKLASTLSNFALYPEGAQHVAPLLTLILPGIDVNDPTKAFFTLSFVADICANGVVLEELPVDGDVPIPAMSSGAPSETAGDTNTEEAVPETDMEEVEWMVRSSTAQFETWIDQYFRRVFMLTDNMSFNLDGSSGMVSFADIKLYMVTARATRLVMFQCSERYHPMIARLVTNYVDSITSLSALDGVCCIVREFASAIPESACANLLPLCCERIKEEVANGVGSVPSLSKRSTTHSETTLIWYASILSSLSERLCAPHILRYKDQIASAINLLLDNCLSRHVYKLACTMLGGLLSALVAIYPDSSDSCRSVPKRVWDDPEFHKNHFRYWGNHSPVSESLEALRWHVPSAEDREASLELARVLIVPRINQLNKMIDELSTKSEHSNTEKVQLHRLLSAITYGLRGVSTAIPPPEIQIGAKDLPDHIAGIDSTNGIPTLFKIDGQVPAGYAFTDPNSDGYKEIEEIRESIGKVALRAMEHMAKSNEDNVAIIKKLIIMAEAFLCYYGTDRNTYDSNKRARQSGIDSFAIDYSTCVIPRYYAVRYAMTVHEGRMLRNSHFIKINKLHHDLSAQLAHFCLSQYSEVRSYAVNVIRNVFYTIPKVKFPLIPVFLKELEDNGSSDPERMTGAVNALNVGPIRNLCRSNWGYLSKVALVLCRAQHEDKPTVKRLIRDFALWLAIFVAPPLPIQEPQPRTLELVNGLGDDIDPQMAAMIDADRARRIQEIDAAMSEEGDFVDGLIAIIRDAGTTWRFAAIAASYLSQLNAVYSPIGPQMASTFADYLTSDLILFRETAAINLTRLLSKIRKRSKNNCPDISINERRVILDTSENSNSLFQKQRYMDLCERALADYASSSSGSSSDTLDPFIDNPAWGWFAWPRKVKAYAPPPSGEGMAYDSIDPGSQKAYDAVKQVVFAEGKWDRIAKLFSLESSRPPESDVIGLNRIFLFTELFALFDLPLLETTWPSFERLARDFENPFSQRAAAEFIGGLLRGSKHWAKASLQKMWDKMIPLLTAVLANLRPDSIHFWQRGLHFAFARRDPRRFLPLLKLIIYGRPFDPHAETPFVEAAKLDFLRTLLATWDWRIVSTIVASKPRLFEALAHPYEQVRVSVGGAMSSLCSLEFSVTYPQVTMAVEDLARYGSTGCDYSYWEGTQRTRALIERMGSQITEWKADHVPSNEGASDFSRGSKTLLDFLLSFFVYSSRRLSIKSLSLVLPLVAGLQEWHDNEDIATMAKGLFHFYAQILCTPQLSESVVANILELLEDPTSTRHLIAQMLPLLYILTFTNRFTLSQEMHTRIVDTTVTFMGHDHVEVRQVASAALTGMIKCANSNVIFDIRRGFSAKLTKRLPRLRNGRQPKNPAAYSKLIPTRHAGVLGLSCLVLAFPYTIPDWMPEVLVQLAECIDDPNPIQATIQRTFAEFRRTHMDTWHEDRKKFTSNQLEILTDMLVSPCYYA